MNLIFLGPPGAGKGTQAQVLSEKAGIPAISTGNIIRSAIKSGTQMGLKARSFTDKGQLVPDDVVIDIIKERLSQDDCCNGFILDGFPRTIAQAEALERMGVEIDAVLEISLPDETIVSRMSGRRVCPNCGASYHITDKKPKDDGVCDGCKSELTQRADDNAETVMERLRVYHEQTQPLIDFYSLRGKLRTVVGREKVADTTKAVLTVLEDML